VKTVFWLDRSLFDKRPGLAEARAFCRNLAHRHYENFTVISFLLPRRLRQDFANVYAYCRIADDLADELGDPAESLRRLDEWQQHLDLCFRGRSIHPVYVALEETIARHQIPESPFSALLAAFRQDQFKHRYDTWTEVLDYCRNSANPVGHLVLYLCGYCDARRQALSDNTCTALQLTNFWQDVVRDHDRGRIYIPRELMDKHGYGEDLLAARVANASWSALMRELIDRTRPLFARGLQLCPLVNWRVRVDIRLFSLGGLEILRAIEEIGYNTLHHRPKLNRRQEARLIAGALVAARIAPAIRR
jgi:squalene synthase HpnC